MQSEDSVEKTLWAANTLWGLCGTVPYTAEDFQQMKRLTNAAVASVSRITFMEI